MTITSSLPLSSTRTTRRRSTLPEQPLPSSASSRPEESRDLPTYPALSSSIPRRQAPSAPYIAQTPIPPCESRPAIYPAQKRRSVTSQYNNPSFPYGSTPGKPPPVAVPFSTPARSSSVRCSPPR